MITSKDNQKIKDLLKLKKAGQRKKSGKFLIEGYKELCMAYKQGVVLDTIFYSKYNKKDLGVFDPSLLLEITNEVFDKISYKENPDGFIAVANMNSHDLSDLKLGDNPFIVVLESLEKPGNLGAVLRTCDAAGVSAVFLVDQLCELYNPNVVRSSLGTLFTNKIVTCNKDEAFSYLSENKIELISSTPAATTLYTDTDYSGPVAISIGTEHDGHTKDFLKRADKKVKIEMCGEIDSLNASVSAAVLIFEAKRQRALKLD